MVEQLFSRFEHYVSAHALFKTDDRLLVAVSGGVDSMVLLSLMARTGLDIAVAHCNFGLRGVESDEDENMVKLAAERLGIQFFNRRFDTTGEMER